MKPLALAVLLALVACTPSPAPPPGASSAAAETRTLKIDSRHLDIEEARKRVVFRPKSDSKRTRVAHYLFDYDEFMKVTGGARDLTLRIEILKSAERTSWGTPGGAVPAGGFRIREITCRILGRAD